MAALMLEMDNYTFVISPDNLVSPTTVLNENCQLLLASVPDTLNTAYLGYPFI